MSPFQAIEGATPPSPGARIQPGEWKMENIEMRTINPDTKEVLMDEKNSGIATLMCYTPKM
ncbi:DUF3617 domain-containing protein, partial [Salmonella enterica subsp. enterica serovar Kentucky]|nr:DUF3617 domain-containing protein [Salmonella enterica subsp. enterica serovar Kentucky]